MREIPDILRVNPNYRRLLLTQILASGLGFSLPFYVILAQESFEAPGSTTGTFLALQTVGATLATLLWGRMSARHGNRRVIRLAVVLQAAIPIYALALVYGPFHLPTAGFGWVATASFAPIFLLIGGTLSGSFIGFNSFLLDVVPEDRRPTYIGITNTSMGCASFFPALGGVLAETVDLNGVFVLSGLSVCAAAVLSKGLKEPD